MTSAATHMVTTGFEQLYTDVRHKEGRVYSDEEVLHLPDISGDHPHYAEWQLRKKSCDRLKSYFENRFGLLKILEVGCGNGWLSQQLASIAGYDVTGTDINLSELLQAERVFSHIPYLQFVYGGINGERIKDGGYDFIVFAASIQYFSSCKDIISQAMRKLKTNGEIHILDSPIYKPGELSSAKERTAKYYSDLGFPEMTEHYFHHSTNDLSLFHYKTMYRPSFINRLSNNKNPFPWLCIKKQ